MYITSRMVTTNAQLASHDETRGEGIDLAEVVVVVEDKNTEETWQYRESGQ